MRAYPGRYISLFALLLSAGCPAASPLDAGTADAGSPYDGGNNDDAGVPDAGIPDAGIPDAGAPDAGPSDGGDPCAAAVLDEALGTLELGAEFVVAAHAPLSASASAVAWLVAPNDAIHVAILDEATASVRDLGGWPELGDDTWLFDVVPDEESASAPFLSSYLAADGQRLAAGYTTFDVDTGAVPGQVALRDAAGTVQRLSAPGNFDAAYLNEVLLVNGLGAGGLPEASGLYGLRPGPGGLEALPIATFPPEWGAFSGYTAVSDNGVVIVGGFYAVGAEAATNHLLALGPDGVAGVLDGDPAIDLAAATPVTSGGVLGATGFGDGVAVLRGEFGQPVEGVTWQGLAVDVGGTVTVTEPAFVLRAVDACTDIQLLSRWDTELVVGIEDASGRRLVRIRRGG